MSVLEGTIGNVGRMSVRNRFEVGRNLMEGRARDIVTSTSQ